MNDRPQGFAWIDNEIVARFLNYAVKAWEVPNMPEVWRRRYVFLSHIETEAEKLREVGTKSQKFT